MNWQDHLVNMRQTIYVEGPAKGTFDISRLIPPQVSLQLVTEEQQSRIERLMQLGAEGYIPPVVLKPVSGFPSVHTKPTDPVETFRELLAPGWYSGWVKLNEAVERYRRELAGNDWIAPQTA